MRRAVAAVVLLALLAACSGDDDDPDAAPATTTTTSTTAPPSYTSDVYADEAAWLCRGDVDDDVCDTDMDATVVNADGTTELERFEPADDAAIDCFYVYPTVSNDQSANSDMTPQDAEEIRTVRVQAARLGEVCDVYAPVYRQATLTLLTSRILGTPAPPGDAAQAREQAYGDVVDAFRHYLANDNDGRGVVLVGHSQGAGLLDRLLREEIDGDDDLRAQLVSALLIGSSVDAGAFENLAPCTDAPGGETGCIVSYAGFRATAPPPSNSFFGRTANGPAICTDPGTELRPYLPSGNAGLIGGGGEPIEWATGVTVDTAFVTLPGLLTAECVEDGTFAYLAVTVHGDPADPRIDDIRGDLTPEWGLHLVDTQITVGNLVDIVDAQADAFAG